MKVFEWEEHFKALDREKLKAVFNSLNSIMNADELIAEEFQGLKELHTIVEYVLESRLRTLRKEREQ